MVVQDTQEQSGKQATSAKKEEQSGKSDKKEEKSGKQATSACSTTSTRVRKKNSLIIGNEESNEDTTPSQHGPLPTSGHTTRVRKKNSLIIGNEESDEDTTPSQLGRVRQQRQIPVPPAVQQGPNPPPRKRKTNPSSEDEEEENENARNTVAGIIGVAVGLGCHAAGDYIRQKGDASVSDLERVMRTVEKHKESNEDENSDLLKKFEEYEDPNKLTSTIAELNQEQKKIRRRESTSIWKSLRKIRRRKL